MYIPLLQIDATQAVVDTTTSLVEAGTATPVATLSVWDLALKGGWIMVVLLLLSLLAIYIFVKKLLQVKAAHKSDSSFMDRIKDYINTHRIDAAHNLCLTVGTPEARMIDKGLVRLGRPMSDISVAIENAGNVEVGKLQTSMPLLATIAAAAPMIGFLGTVTGMVRAFFDMANAGSSVDIALLSGGIYEALVTRVGGLIVGIITLFAYNFLVARIDKAINVLEARSIEFMDALNELSEPHDNQHP